MAWARVASLRLPSPLIEPHVRISRIRLSDWRHRKAHGGRPIWTDPDEPMNRLVDALIGSRDRSSVGAAQGAPNDVAALARNDNHSRIMMTWVRRPLRASFGTWATRRPTAIAGI